MTGGDPRHIHRLLKPRCSGTVGAIVTCPLEVLKTRLQSSGITLRPMFQVQLGTLNGTGVIRPGSGTVTPPSLLQVLRCLLFQLPVDVNAASLENVALGICVVPGYPQGCHTTTND
ncbi:unnamed protein product [Coregonus sp. 'balchen']|nr:unnamed protein product [Coregonus sp. 'balchen']